MSLVKFTCLAPRWGFPGLRLGRRGEEELVSVWVCRGTRLVLSAFLCYPQSHQLLLFEPFWLGRHCLDKCDRHGPASDGSLEGFRPLRWQRRPLGDFCDVLSTSGGSVRIADSSFAVFAKTHWLDVALDASVFSIRDRPVVTPHEISVLIGDLELMD